ncbi:37S ribosomal protein S9 [Aspergillus sclerotiicarbonarius CBS 121057]|uniref:Small ribosomal subunit protein uS9m n=1 Tax=Aspergillus sclerotiicarbonarius (strain CBS 121057 / IBT 28362) TaxID=1448318 RepID=A0A319ETS8_ASPSB|nr:37S ribosomal protein S9 [Aspergillus sclerotiicarbonarius CBS 121057]
MAWQSPNGLVHAMHSIRRAAQLRPFLQRSVISASPISSPSTPAGLRQRMSARGYATELEPVAAAPINLAEFQAKPARIVPASAAYFSGSPKFIDHMLKLEALLARYASLPTVSPSEAPRMAWFKLLQFRDVVGEPVPTKKYKALVKLLQRLNRINPSVAPEEVRSALSLFLRPGNPYGIKPAPATVDEQGRARGKGKRKASSAVVHLVEGEGEVLVNGKTLNEVFPRLHDRESAVWPLRCTSRLDKYNVWATVQGGGVTGQAEAITLAVARALLVHEPGLKPILRKAGVITVDARRVERKKPGHVKARKMPTWVKR